MYLWRVSEGMKTERVRLKVCWRADLPGCDSERLPCWLSNHLKCEPI